MYNNFCLIIQSLTITYKILPYEVIIKENKIWNAAILEELISSPQNMYMYIIAFN